MAASHVDRNLLFGILALQMDFISRDQLVRGMNAWVLAKAKPLGEILVGLGHMADANRRLLEPLVDAHVRRHGDDPAQSLAALSSTSRDADALLAVQDDQVQASLLNVQRQPASPYVPIPTVIHEGPSAFERLRFRILRPHAKGGLGQVYVAHDQELGRRVALKEVRLDKSNDPHLRSRFVLEAEINGNLEHPGIVPVYGMGTYSDGRPFYAMRFVEGDSLREAIARFHAVDSSTTGALSDGKKAGDFASLEFRQLLGRFVDVCEAIAYAHSRGVLHRDLKPDNIMLGRYGETLVVDWGLAKAVGRRDADAGASTEEMLVPQSGHSEDPTLAGSALGTPAYMSPEQAEGKLDALGPATDVYALGATLHHLLTGVQPLEGLDLSEILRRVIRGEVPSPRALRPDVPKALDAVCRKAMALKPADRYDSTKAIAEDVERWLADEPVSAWHEPRRRRAARWVRRHRTLTTSAVAVLAVGLIGLLAHSTLLSARNAELVRERLRAEEVETLAIEAVRKFRAAVKDADPPLEGPTLRPLRETLLAEARDAFKKIRDLLRRGGDRRPATLARLAQANSDLAATTAEFGRGDDAVPAFEEAIRLYAKLAADSPAEDRYRNLLASAEFDLGTQLFKMGPDRLVEAQRSHNNALRLREKLVADHPDSPTYRLDLARSLANGANREGPTVAVALLKREFALLNAMPSRGPGDFSVEIQVAGTWKSLGDRLVHLGQQAEAHESYKRALEVYVRAARDRPDAARVEPEPGRFDIDLALGQTYTALGRWDEALASFDRAIASYKRLVDDHPDRIDLRGVLASCYQTRGGVLNQLERFEEAAAALRRAIREWDEILRKAPGRATTRAEMAKGLHDLGRVELGLGKTAMAVETLHRAIGEFERAQRDGARASWVRSRLGRSYRDLALAQIDLGRLDQALQTLDRAIEDLAQDPESDPEIPFYFWSLANSYLDLARGVSSHSRGPQELDLRKVAERLYSRAEAEFVRLRDTPSLDEYEPGKAAITLIEIATERRQLEAAARRAAEMAPTPAAARDNPVGLAR